MNPPDLKKARAQQLLAAADAQVARDSPAAPDPRPAEELLHELQVRQVELEMQNEELRQSRNEFEVLRDRYADLYEFAPVGYLTLDAHGLITGSNLAGATLIGVERKQLLQRRLTAFVSPEDQNRWMTHFLQARRGKERSTIELLVKRGDGTRFEARLDCVPVSDPLKVGAGDTAIRATLTDINDRALSKQSDNNFRAIFERSPIGIGIAGSNQRYRKVNPALCRMLGYSEEELLTMSFVDITHPDDVKLNLWNIEGLAAHEADHFSMEKRYVRKDGEIVWVSLNVVAVRATSGTEGHTVGLAEDITERKQAEAQRLAFARQQRDTLVREVHHRIKNNLQSVAGLLQRELGRFVEHNPRLEAAISQVNAIAVVHGLQSIHADEAIRLCESVRSICGAVSDLSQRPVLFNIEHEQTTFRPVRVENSEAVSIALVLNELILNAVKHSPPGSAAASVSLSANGTSAEVMIRNARIMAHTFDIDSGDGLGTGLRLVRSLLPAEGAHLDYETDGAGFMLTRLRLTAPVVAKPESRG